MPWVVTAAVPSRMPRASACGSAQLSRTSPAPRERARARRGRRRRTARGRRARGGCRCRRWPRRTPRRAAPRRGCARWRPPDGRTRAKAGVAASPKATALAAMVCICGAALGEGEDGAVDPGGQLRAAEDEPAARPAQHLVGGGAHDVGVRDRARRRSPRDQADGVRGVRDEVGAHVVGDLPEGRVVRVAGVGDGAAHDRLGPVLRRQVPHLAVVDEPGRPRSTPYPTKSNQRPEKLAGEPWVRWPPYGSAHRQHGVARLQERRVGRQHRRSPRMRLYVGVGGPEQGLGAVDGDALGDVHDFAAAVVAGAWIPSAYLLPSCEPRAARTAGEVKFSAAISCSEAACRSASPSSTSAISGSCRLRASNPASSVPTAEVTDMHPA